MKIRRRDVSRTVTNTSVTVVCVDTSKDEIVHVKKVVQGVFKNEKDLLKHITLDNDNLKLSYLKDVKQIKVRYNMDLDDFIKLSKMEILEEVENE